MHTEQTSYAPRQAVIQGIASEYLECSSQRGERFCVIALFQRFLSSKYESFHVFVIDDRRETNSREGDAEILQAVALEEPQYAWSQTSNILITRQIAVMLCRYFTKSRFYVLIRELSGLAPAALSRRAGLAAPAGARDHAAILTGPASGALLLNQPDVFGKYASRHGPTAAREETGNRRDPTHDVVALHALNEEPEIVHHLELRVLTALLALRIDDRVVQRHNRDARADAGYSAPDHTVAGRIPGRVRILRDQGGHALLGGSDHVSVFGRHHLANLEDVRVAIRD